MRTARGYFKRHAHSNLRSILLSIMASAQDVDSEHQQMFIESVRNGH